ncbi:hypothetical protein E3U43_007370 [Larimichthys crocea]|uniref:Uncharacterized protein n=1 Tax=Larimichthys crocea TaxID=215358 RepID=A0ACD3RNC8_LARCR|nr:hypothetical protein E3U43_007370 [Larimichthys crocea]
MEGPPVLTQSGDEKYPDMVKVLSAAQHCLVWEPQSSVTEKQIFLVPAWRFASNKTRTNQRPASVEGSRLVWQESKLIAGRRTAWGIVSLALK